MFVYEGEKNLYFPKVAALSGTKPLKKKKSPDVSTPMLAKNESVISYLFKRNSFDYCWI